MSKTSDLLAQHNELATALGRDTLRSWKRSKTDLMKRIADMRIALATARREAGNAAEPPKKRRAAKKAGTPKKDKPGRTIREAALGLLCAVDYYEDRSKDSGPDNVVEAGHEDARGVGLPYDEIIRRIKEEFPECKTTVACLRWYSVKVRVEEFGYEGLRLPQRRPRAKPRF